LWLDAFRRSASSDDTLEIGCLADPEFALIQQVGIVIGKVKEEAKSHASSHMHVLLSAILLLPPGVGCVRGRVREEGAVGGKAKGNEPGGDEGRAKGRARGRSAGKPGGNKETVPFCETETRARR
ncbi:hypothetical protein QQP08_016093, partial [Theobroma cacao]